MKQSFPLYLLESGFKCFRQLPLRECEFTNHYSSTVSGELDYLFTKDGVNIVWGLREAGYPPTLISPMIKDPDTQKWLDRDNEINKWLLRTSNEDILEEINKYQ